MMADSYLDRLFGPEANRQTVVIDRFKGCQWLLGAKLETPQRFGCRDIDIDWHPQPLRYLLT
jgi:hypothetical protein